MTALLKHISTPIQSSPANETIAMFQLMAKMNAEIAGLKNEMNKLVDNSNTRKILIPSVHGYVYVSISDIVYCKAEGSYTAIFMLDGSSLLLSKTLKSMEKQFNMQSLVRCHQSYLINKEYVSRIVDFSCEIKIDNHELRIPISRRKLPDVLSALGSLH